MTGLAASRAPQAEPPGAAAPARGRPRDPGLDSAILGATLELLTELGYDQLSVEAVAARARVTRATVYRHYPGKAELVAAAVDQRGGPVPAVFGGGDPRDALLSAVQWLAQEIAGQEIGVLGAVFAGMRSDPGLASAMRRILRRDEAAMTDACFRGPAQDGEHLAPRAAELLAEIAPAIIVHRLIIAGEPCDQGFLEHLVDDILLPLASGQLDRKGPRP